MAETTRLEIVCGECGEHLIVVAERLDHEVHSYGWAIYCLVCESRINLGSPIRNVFSVSRLMP
jgi:hypothetical protein